MTLAELVNLSKTAFLHQLNKELEQYFQIFLSQDLVKGRLLMSFLSLFKSVNFPPTFLFPLAIYLLDKQAPDFADCLPVVLTGPFVPAFPGKG